MCEPKSFSLLVCCEGIYISLSQRGTGPHYLWLLADDATTPPPTPAVQLTNTHRQLGVNSEQTSSVLPQQVTSDPKQRTPATILPFHRSEVMPG